MLRRGAASKSSSITVQAEAAARAHALGAPAEKPGTIRVATVPGSMWDYLVEQIEANTGAKFLRVPFQGGGAGITALVGGNVDVAQGFFSEFRGHLEAGKVKPVAV